MRNLAMAAGLGVVLAVALAACGKQGAPHPVGPPDQVIFPKTYPTH